MKFELKTIDTLGRLERLNAEACHLEMVIGKNSRLIAGEE